MSFFRYPGFATDSTVALLIGLLFFIIPAKKLTKTTPTGEIGWVLFIIPNEFDWRAKNIQNSTGFS